MTKELKKLPLVLILDDDPVFSTLVSHWLTKEGFRVKTYHTAHDFIEDLPLTFPDVVCLDIGLPDMDGMDVLPIIRKWHRSVPVIYLTGEKEVNMVVKAMQQGAYDYITKPPDHTKLTHAVHNAAEWFNMTTRLASLEKDKNRFGYNSIIGLSSVMREVYRQIEKVASTDITVLVNGESGTGKELVAREIHNNSERITGPFIAVNCAAITETLQESEFFGHEKGAFTGAYQQKPGFFERAHKGTLFLDEVGELSTTLQAKLLRVLQEHVFERVGGIKTIESDFRLIAATNRNLTEMVQRGEFREDLLYRIAVLEIEIPPLRERAGDLRLLIDTLLSGLTISTGSDRPYRINDRAMKYMENYPWPGNVRELQNILQRAVVVSEDNVITPNELPRRLTSYRQEEAPSHGFEQMRHGVTGGVEPAPPAPQGTPGTTAPLPAPTPTSPGSHPATAQSPGPGEDQAQSHPPGSHPQPKQAPVNYPFPGGENPLDMTLSQLERWAITNAIQTTNGNISEAMRRLEISRTTLYRKLKEYGLR